MKILFGDICLRKSEPIAMLFLFAGLRRLKGVGSQCEKESEKRASDIPHTTPRRRPEFFYANRL